MPRISVLILFICLSASHVVAETIVIAPSDDLHTAVTALAPGDELVLTAGEYLLSRGLKISLTAEEASPSIIRAQDEDAVLIRLPSADHNIVEIRSSRFLTIRGLRFSGGSHGLRLMDSDFITIEDCEIFETGDVAISAKAGGTYEGLVIRRNHIHHTNGTGEGLYLGCNHDRCRVANSLVEGNYIHHTNRASVDQGDGIEIKEGSFGNVVRDNVIHDTKYPGILTYSTAGNGPANVIERNLVWNVSDYPIQSAADAIIRNNIVLGGPVVMQAHQAGRPSNLVVAHNTIISPGAGIVVRDVSGPVQIVNNAVFAASEFAINVISGEKSMVQVEGNVGEGRLAGARTGLLQVKGIAGELIDADYDRLPPVDVFPAPGSQLVGSGVKAFVTAVDFNGSKRNGEADAGAYKFDENGNPGWVLQPAFKEPGIRATMPQPGTGSPAP